MRLLCRRFGERYSRRPQSDLTRVRAGYFANLQRFAFRATRDVLHLVVTVFRSYFVGFFRLELVEDFQRARYLGKITGRSRAQVTRLIARYRAHGELQPVPYRRHRFPQRYTRADVELLATVDEAHESLSGPATRRILQRAYE